MPLLGPLEAQGREKLQKNLRTFKLLAIVRSGVQMDLGNLSHRLTSHQAPAPLAIRKSNKLASYTSLISRKAIFTTRIDTGLARECQRLPVDGEPIVFISTHRPRWRV